MYYRLAWLGLCLVGVFLYVLTCAHIFPSPGHSYRKHFDPFAAALSAKSSFHAGLSGNSGSHKRGKPLSYLALSVAAGAASGDGVPRAMRDVEARRVAEDGAGKVGCWGWVGLGWVVTDGQYVCLSRLIIGL